jgi:hypothetical protein
MSDLLIHTDEQYRQARKVIAPHIRCVILLIGTSRHFPRSLLNRGIKAVTGLTPR